MHKGLTLLEVLVILGVLAVLAALALPPLCPSRRWSHRQACANNLKQLHALAHLYSTLHQGSWPPATGEGLWLALQEVRPPLIEEEVFDVFFCPIKGQSLEKGKTDYRGPAVEARLLKPTDPLGADKIGNHGPDEAGCVLRMAGDVTSLDLGDTLWKESKRKLSP